ncbi:hypothetical protein PHLCEN_2v10959 [Hermanssonia centrifuga]|uniref:Uncharacterized protein n=1 Tax=Hermanssonia centrifuga TaxID=98765 RepID=A0A2R6NMD3_9APHY|nr:hypothetical protein PHLCEN_2v10959 [Hermanssonia centrifuga]
MALVAVPSHRIQTIHGAFGSPSFASMLPVGSHAQASSFNSLPNVSFSSCRGGRGANLSILAARTAAASAPPTPIVTRPRRPSIRQVPITTRRAAPPPPRTAVASAQDPFADSQHVEVASEPTRASSRPVMVTYTFTRTEGRPEDIEAGCQCSTQPGKWKALEEEASIVRGGKALCEELLIEGGRGRVLSTGAAPKELRRLLPDIYDVVQ